ncbi:hypothetical protein QCA50_020895 [Cerrena zonata]|uniref:Cytochrome P450 n=1 Tax=Cerrena zonata TaxID=2478898 RepID=A0AAW0FC71_9APHY
MNAVVGLLFLTLVYFILHRFLNPRKGKLPPSPRGWPIIGNALQLGNFPWLQMTRWSEQLGPIYSLNLGGQTAIVLNSYRVASEILDKRSAIYSDRPRMIMTSEILSGNLFFPFNRYGDLWRKLRKASFEGLHSRAIHAYYPYQLRESAILVEALAKDSEHWRKHLNRAVKSAVLSVSYALPSIESEDDPLVSYIDDFMHRLERAARPGEFLVEIFPILNYLPPFLAKWKRDGQACHEEDTDNFVKWYRDAITRANAGKCGQCISRLLMKNPDLNEKEAAWIAGTMFGGGSSTTGSAHQVFVLAMVSFPEVMRKAQAQLDAVVGRTRFPSAEDRPNLPYIEAIIREVLRWHNIGPLGVPHASSEDDIYEGYFIPKGSIIFFNGWAFSRDRELFPDPENFRPERYLDGTETKENIPPFTHNEGHTAFGYGRRKCVGIHIANSTLFQNIATLLWAFNIERVKDGNGIEIVPDMDDFLDTGLAVFPAPFPCRFVPRDPDVLDIAAGVREATLDAHLSS